MKEYSRSGIQPGLVQELGGLQVVESCRRSASSGSSAIAWSSANGTSLPMTEADLQEALVLRAAAGRCAPRASTWTVAGPGSPGPVASADTGPRSPASAFVSTSVRTVSSRKNGLPAPDEELLERRQPGIVAEQRVQQLPGALGRQRVQPHLAVVRLAAPGVLVLGTVVHEQQQARRAEALDQRCRAAPASRRRSSADPRRSRASGCSRASRSSSRLTASSVRWRRCAGARAPARRHRPRARRAGPATPAASARGRDRSVSSLPVTFSRISLQVVPILDLEVALEQIDHRQVARRLAVRDARRSRGPASPAGDASE